MEHLQIRQSDLAQRLGWPKSRISDLVTGKQRYNRDIINAIAAALHIEPYELLMAPTHASVIRELELPGSPKHHPFG